MTEIVHIPAIRAGVDYESLDSNEIVPLGSTQPIARVSQVNAGIIRRDLKKLARQAETLRKVSSARMFEICREAGRLFMNESLLLSEAGPAQSPDDYVTTLSSTSGLTHAMVRRNMEKIVTMLDTMPAILRGLTRGLDPALLDTGTVS